MPNNNNNNNNNNFSDYNPHSPDIFSQPLSPNSDSFPNDNQLSSSPWFPPYDTEITDTEMTDTEIDNFLNDIFNDSNGNSLNNFPEKNNSIFFLTPEM